MTRLPKKPRKVRVRKAKAPKVAYELSGVDAAFMPGELERLFARARLLETWKFGAGAYWCHSVGLLPVVEPYIDCGGASGRAFGIRVALLGGQAYAEWRLS